VPPDAARLARHVVRPVRGMEELTSAEARRIALAVIYRAALDAKAGRRDAIDWLASEEALSLAEMLGLGRLWPLDLNDVQPRKEV